jgi:hypothetical protein|tara:strand:+ start:898 stop:1167 length:270 start_codon:yes stop_codon:yes gene_type:complete
MFNKLTSVAALLAAVSGIGGGFYAWGEFQTRLSAIEEKEYIVNETVDLSDIYGQISEISKQLAITDAKVDFVDAKVEEIKAEAANPFAN